MVKFGLLVALGSCLVDAVPAGSGARQASNAAPTETSSPDSKPRQYLLLNTDRVVEGEIEKGPHGYTVRRNGGVIQFPLDQVVFAGPSLRAIYEYKTSHVPKHDMGEHYRIYQWCLVRGMEDEAASELRTILEVDPTNARANRLLSSLNRKHEPAKPTKKAGTPRVIPAAPNEVIDNFVRGHGRETFEKYTDVERVLINRCGTAACHGTSRYTGDFRLFRREGDIHSQRMTARNLRAVLQFVNLEDPQKSRILTQAVEPHGGLSIPAMGGINDPQYKDLRDWVFTVAQKWSVDDAAVAKKPRLVPESVTEPEELSTERWEAARKTKFARPVKPEPGDDIPPTVWDRAYADDAPPPQADTMPTNGKREAVDPFDPAAFNHPATTKPLAAKATKKTPRAGIPKEFDVPTEKAGKPFRAAPLPFSLRGPRKPIVIPPRQDPPPEVVPQD